MVKQIDAEGELNENEILAEANLQETQLLAEGKANAAKVRA